MPSQEETNHREWENPDNWGGSSWCAVYFSKRDSRVFVPKRIPWMGGTVNLARGVGVAFFVGSFLLALFGLAAALVISTCVTGGG